MHLSRTPASGRHGRATATLIAGGLAFGLCALISGCAETFRDATNSPGTTSSPIQARFEQLLEGVGARFAPNDFAPKYKIARVKLAQSALVPSRIFDDTSLWEARPSASQRLLYVVGEPVDAHYHLESRATLPPATRAGESRHTISLEQVAPNIYRWDTRVELAVGAMSSEEISDLISAVLRSPENRTEATLREDYRGAFSRSTAAFGKGFAVDSLHVSPGAQGTTNVTITLGFHPELMRGSYPALAGYLDKYLGPAKYRFALAERGGGAAMMEVVGRDRAMTMRYRLHDGKLVSLLGPPIPWPDTLQMSADVSVKVKLFTVGFHNLVADFAISNSGHDRGWSVIAQHEPSWDLPFITERLIRSPLRRPFEGQGSLFRLDVDDSPNGGPTMFSRRTRLDVQESAIMRFIGSLASHALGDLDDKVEIDEHRFLKEGLSALEGDLRGLRR